MIEINPDRIDTLIDALTTLWEASVRATHHFLTEDDVQMFIPFVRMGLGGIKTLVVAAEGDKPIAFMGIEKPVKLRCFLYRPTTSERGWKAVSRACYFTIRGAVCGCERAKSASDRILRAYRIRNV